jgi:hypothetical protein
VKKIKKDEKYENIGIAWSFEHGRRRESFT